MNALTAGGKVLDLNLEKLHVRTKEHFAHVPAVTNKVVSRDETTKIRPVSGLA